MLHRKHATVGEQPTWLVVRAHADHRYVWFSLQQIKKLAVAVEEMNTGLQLVLKDEVLVVVSDVDDVAADQIVECALPLASLFKVCREVILLLLVDIRV